MDDTDFLLVFQIGDYFERLFQMEKLTEGKNFFFLEIEKLNMSLRTEYIVFNGVLPAQERLITAFSLTIERSISGM